MDWVGPLSPRVAVLATATRVPLLAGRFQCRPNDPAWHELNRIGDVAHVVFPRTAVQITPADGAPLAADANRLLLYHAGEEYRRAPLDPRGDDSLFVAVGDEALDELGRCGALVDRRYRFPRRERSCPPALYASVRLLHAGGPEKLADPLWVDELLVGAVTQALSAGPETPADGSAALMEPVRAILSQRLDQPLALADVAAALDVSPWHLHRRFRAATGWTIHAYRDHLRLREGLARVLDGASDLATVAVELGYASHSHFTARFRRAFAMTPSAARRRGLDPRKIVTVEDT